MLTVATEREREGQSGRRRCLADPAFVHKMFEWKVRGRNEISGKATEASRHATPESGRRPGSTSNAG